MTGKTLITGNTRYGTLVGPRVVFPAGKTTSKIVETGFGYKVNVPPLKAMENLRKM